jgi:hypothetical protein
MLFGIFGPIFGVVGANYYEKSIQKPVYSMFIEFLK